MAKKQINSPLDDSQEPDWPTQKKKLMEDGRAIGIDNSVWLYRRVPLGPVDTAKTTDDALNIAAPLADAFRLVAETTSIRAPRRQFAKAKYRDIHLLIVNIPERFDPYEQPLGTHLLRQFPDQNISRRILIMGVRLQPSLRGGGWKQAVSSVAETLSPEAMEVNLNEYIRDTQVVDAAMTRAGLQRLTPDEFHICDSWWNAGQFPDTPYLVHPDHLHMFTATDSLGQAARLEREKIDCMDPAWSRLSRHHTLSMVSFDQFTQSYTDITSPSSYWASELLQLGAAAISIRGKLEPGELTRNQLRAGRKAYLGDIMDAEKEGTTMDRADQTEKLQTLEHMEAAYASAGAPPSLIECSVIAALSGSDENGSFDAASIGAQRLKLSNMAMRQEKALAEMMMCSQVRSNPNLKDLPTTAIAYSGLPSLSVVGDRTGALLGFTEHDNQPAYVSSTAASAGDASPIMLVAGQTGSGKLLPLDARIPTPQGWTTMGELKVGDEVLGRHGQTTRVSFVSEINKTPDLYKITLSDGQIIEADHDHQWIVSTFQDRNGHKHPHRVNALARWRKQSSVAARIEQFKPLDDYEGIVASTPNSNEYGYESGERILAYLDAKLGKDNPWPNVASLQAALNMMDYGYTDESGFDHSRVFPVLARRLRQQLHNRPVDSFMERRMTTGEMLAEGLHLAQGQAKFAIRVADAIELPESNVSVDPYIFGAWLGDGDSSCGGMTSHQDDQGHLIDKFFDGGYDLRVRPSSQNGQRLVADGLWSDLLGTGLERRERASLGLIKRIPNHYLRGSIKQRMALLQGLMDTDGTISKKGSCEFSVSDADLAGDVLELIRSLGIKASMSVGSSSYRDDDGVRVACKNRYRIKFTTDKQVFTLPRKLERLPRVIRETNKWLYITDIEQTQSRPGRCIQVEDEDHVYLADGFVPTSNTQVLLWLASQWAQSTDEFPNGVPQIIVDPKQDSDHTTTVEGAGGRVMSLDELSRADGVFDPLRFAASGQAGVDAAASILLQVNPWREGSKVWEADLTVALGHGVERGAKCIGQALQIALDDGVAPEAMVKPVLELANKSSFFRACVGTDPDVKGLRAADGITLIKAGNAPLDLPAPGKEPESLQQRICVALVRMMVFGSAMALTGRKGVLHFDEAWVAMSGGATEVERLGRLARSQGVLPIMYTQRVSDAVNNGLTGYISRGIILAIADRDEAVAACMLFGLEPTAERLDRIMAKDRRGGSADQAEGALNYNSLRALFEYDPTKPEGRGRNLRGSVGIYVDLVGRAVPVVITLPTEFFKLSSTNPLDIAEREARLRAERIAAKKDKLVKSTAAVPSVSVSHGASPADAQESRASEWLGDIDFDNLN